MKNTLRSIFLFACMAPFLMATMCEDADDNIPCTLEVLPGLTVEFKDAVTGQPLYYGFNSLNYADGENVGYLRLVQGSEPPVFQGAMETPGTYILTINRVGYQPYVSEPITVTKDECHVINQYVVIELQPQ